MISATRPRADLTATTTAELAPQRYLGRDGVTAHLPQDPHLAAASPVPTSLAAAGHLPARCQTRATTARATPTAPHCPRCH